MSAAPIYVVVASTGGARQAGYPNGGPIVMETEADGATLEAANERAAHLERHYGACRVGRVVFEGEPGFEVADSICREGDCHYYGQKRPSSCACSWAAP